MEHRCTERRPITLNAQIYRHGALVGTGKTRDLGLGGTFVKTRWVGYAENTPLEVKMTLRNGKGKRRQFRLPAVVIHHNGEGLGLMFHALDGEAIQALWATLFVAEQSDSTRLPALGSAGNRRQARYKTAV
ncbi:MAG: PilZ domain-containing protein [Pseudomonadota bacterium]|nr:PilZ domain-containing protein [Pseudomonadota bacterium]